MSVVIAARYNKGIAIIADKQATLGTTKTDGVTKVKHFEKSQSCIGTVGHLRDCNVMRTIDEIIPYADLYMGAEIDEDYVIKSIVPGIINTLHENRRINDASGIISMNSSMIYVTKDKMFHIGQDFGAYEIQECFGVIGSGDDKVRGFMTGVGNTAGMSEKQITKVLGDAISKACETDVYINNKMDLIFCTAE